MSLSENMPIDVEIYQYPKRKCSSCVILKLDVPPLPFLSYENSFYVLKNEVVYPLVTGGRKFN